MKLETLTKIKVKLFNLQVYNLLTDGNLTESHKKIPCKVLINSHETKEMNLGELLQYTKALKKGDLLLSSIPISCHFSNHDSFLLPHFKKQPEFWLFLWHLYYVFRKMEIKLEKFGRSDLIYTIRSRDDVHLDTVKIAYKSMDRSDFLKMYPVMKQLFYSYMDYIQYMLNEEDEIIEAKYIPGSIDELKMWYQKLNEIFIISCRGYGHVMEKLLRTEKFQSWNVIESKISTQPFVDLRNEKVLFGFVNMDAAEPMRIPSDAPLLFKKCSTGCTNEPRKWLCMKCGDFVLIKDWILYCSCGGKRYKDNSLICVDQYEHKWDLKQAPVLITPIRYQQVALRLRRTTKYSNINVIEDDEACEPYIGDSDGDEHLFGFVDMTGAKHENIPEEAELLRHICPNECTNIIRKWICTKCGNYVYFSDWTLYCSCGLKEYKEELFSCHHSNHMKTSDSEINSIVKQLQKIAEERVIVDRKIGETIKVLLTSTNKSLITSILKELQNIPLNEHCHKTINDFLDNAD